MLLKRWILLYFDFWMCQCATVKIKMKHLMFKLLNSSKISWIEPCTYQLIPILLYSNGNTEKNMFSKLLYISDMDSATSATSSSLKAVSFLFSVNPRGLTKPNFELGTQLDFSAPCNGLCEVTETQPDKERVSFSKRSVNSEISRITNQCPYCD